MRMKSLDQIKQEYAIAHKFANWNHFCQLANEQKLIKAIDDIALTYANNRFFLRTGDEPVEPLQAIVAQSYAN